MNAKELLLLFLGVIAIFVGIGLAVWLAIFNYYLVFIPASLALIAWLVYCVIKGIRTGEWHHDNGVITRNDDPYLFWIMVVFTCPCIVFGLLYWLYADPLQKLINDGWGGLAQ